VVNGTTASIARISKVDCSRDLTVRRLNIGHSGSFGSSRTLGARG
jgi:hypothetical protein